MDFDLVLDHMLFVYCQLENRMATKVIPRLCNLALGCAPRWSQMLWRHTTRGTTSRSDRTAHWFETCHYTATPQSEPMYKGYKKRPSV